MDPSKKGKMENAQGVIALEYEPTIVSIGLLFTHCSVQIKLCCSFADW